MRIGLFCDTYPPDINGVATATKNLFDILTQMGHDVYVITTNFAGEKKISEKDHVIRIPGIVMKKLYSYRAAGIFNRKVYMYLQRKGFDIIHVQTEAGIGTFGRLVASFLEVPFVYTYHTMYTDYAFYLKEYFPVSEKVGELIMSAFSKNWALAPDQTITTSNKTKDALIKFGVDRYINVIPNGFDFKTMEINEIDKNKIEEIRKRFSLDKGTSMVVVGRLGKEKGLDFLIRCFKRLKEETNLNPRLLIVGEGGYKPELQKLVKRLGLDENVFFVGSVPHEQVKLYYRACDLTLSGSLSETQGLTIAESMATRSIVLVREDSNFKPLVEDGKTGFFFQDEESFVNRVKTFNSLSKEQKDKLGNQAFLKDQELNSLEAFGRSVEYVYKKARRDFW